MVNEYLNKELCVQAVRFEYRIHVEGKSSSGDPHIILMVVQVGNFTLPY